jgi:hypothetical protein
MGRNYFLLEEQLQEVSQRLKYSGWPSNLRSYSALHSGRSLSVEPIEQKPHRDGEQYAWKNNAL